MMRRILKVFGIILGVIVVIFIGLLIYINMRWDAKVERSARDIKAPRDSATIARGEFLYKASLTCWDCHSPGHDANTPPSGGFKFDLTTGSPSLGVYYASNITSDTETGIGNWTDGEIVLALREGISKNGKVLFPIMPTGPLHGLSDKDVLAIVAYLRTIPPVRHVVPARELSLFAKMLFAFGGIGPMNEIKTPVIAPQRALTQEFGGYLAKHSSLCVDCHTPRNLKTGEFYYDSLLAGSTILYGTEEDYPVMSYAPNITPESETGIGKWTEEQFLLLMRTGIGADGKVRTRHMPYAYYSMWDSLDLKALYLYLRSIKPVLRNVPSSVYIRDAASSDRLTKGRGLFNSYCIACHGKEGKGAIPTHDVLAEMVSSLTDNDLEEFIMAGNIDLKMPGFGKTLSQEDFKAVLQYIRSWSAQ